ncbi:rRNA-processing protein utp23 [Escovopsis weberi]|uniref:U three protein 23 n=1 Tax=Escovopsis weberi TaxID=150374 RepID=A0A0M8MU41_ESCWE|nr:rRNA-processing protein utp23 [Escovopsis weberi]
MRGKRSKQYRKLMEQFSQTFGFREPYQILVDAEMVQDATRFKMDLAAGLQRTVHGKVKPMITQCEIRKLYAQKAQPGGNDAIDLAKGFERRRCGHHPDQYPEPLETMECMRSVVDPKSTGQNKNRYVVASQSQAVRRMLRGIKGVPLIYIKRSVMILEPMADESVELRQREERGKFRADLKPTLGKRKRGEESGGTTTATTPTALAAAAATTTSTKRNGAAEGKREDHDDDEEEEKEHGAAAAALLKKAKKQRGVKGVNPLSMLKKKRKTAQDAPKKKAKSAPTEAEETAAGPAKRKRKKKVKPEGGAAASASGDGEASSGPSKTPAGEES